MSMRLTRLLLAFILSLALVSTAFAAPTAAEIAAPQTDEVSGNGERSLFQYSTITALNRGEFAGGITVGELARHGNLGLGAMADLNGEVIAVDGTFYRAEVTGALHELSADDELAFAGVTNFEPDHSYRVGSNSDWDQLEAWLTRRLSDPEAFYAVKMTGDFKYLQARSVPAQTEPFPTLAEVVANQTEFEFTDVSGVLVGFVAPAYAAGVMPAGLHLHFVTADRTLGGHVLDLTTSQVTVEVMELHDLGVKLQSPGAPTATSEAPVDAAPAVASDEDLAAQLFALLHAEDVDGMASFLATDFMIQRADGTHLGKEAYLANLPTVESFAVTDVVGRQAADNVRVVRYSVEASEIIDGQYITKDPVPRLSVFIWNGERWQLFAHSNFAPIEN